MNFVAKSGSTKYLRAVTQFGNSNLTIAAPAIRKPPTKAANTMQVVKLSSPFNRIIGARTNLIGGKCRFCVVNKSCGGENCVVPTTQSFRTHTTYTRYVTSVLCV